MRSCLWKKRVYVTEPSHVTPPPFLRHPFFVSTHALDNPRERGSPDRVQRYQIGHTATPHPRSRVAFFFFTSAAHTHTHTHTSKSNPFRNRNRSHPWGIWPPYVRANHTTNDGHTRARARSSPPLQPIPGDAAQPFKPATNLHTYFFRRAQIAGISHERWGSYYTHAKKN